MFSNTKVLTIPDGEVVKIESNGIVIWEMPSSFKNWVPYSINADGTIYNNGLGYKNNCRIRSGGAEGTISTASCTGYIPVKGLSKIRVAGCVLTKSTDTAINVSDASFTNIGQVAGNGNYGIFTSTYKAYNNATIVQKDGYWEWTVPPVESGVKYIRVTGSTGGSGGSNLIVTVDEEITD